MLILKSLDVKLGFKKQTEATGSQGTCHASCWNWVDRGWQGKDLEGGTPDSGSFSSTTLLCFGVMLWTRHASFFFHILTACNVASDIRL